MLITSSKSLIYDYSKEIFFVISLVKVVVKSITIFINEKYSSVKTKSEKSDLARESQAKWIFRNRGLAVCHELKKLNFDLKEKDEKRFD